MWSQGEERASGVERVGEGVDVGLVVVQVDGGPGGSSDTEHPHERLGAVMASAHADATLVEDLGDVVRMHVTVGEREHPAPLFGVGGALEDELITESLLEDV
jgi:hypothetical protein